METLIPRLLRPPKESFFLFGPRGTGKSTWLKSHFPDALYVDLLEPDVARAYSAYPERLRELVSANPKKTVIIDEIQKIPQLLTVVHALIEKKAGIQFILTGSSSRKLKRTGVDLLAGRAVVQSMHPFMAAELGKKFNLNDALANGLIPLVYSAVDIQKVLRTYAALYVREEVQMEGLVRNIGNFSRFLEAIAFSHACVLNVSNVARECAVERKVVEGYISILEDLLLSYRVGVFTRKAKRVVIRHQKFYYFDAGLFRSLRMSGPLDSQQEIDGAALEGLVAQHLIAWDAYRGNQGRLFYWRTPSGTEVDFVMYGKDIFWAIEVKNSNRVRPEDLSGLKAFKEDYPESKAYLLYRGKERLLKDGITCMPVEDFLMSLDPGAQAQL
jgi:predicted AAA+ superfamily ATPase